MNSREEVLVLAHGTLSLLREADPAVTSPEVFSGVTRLRALEVLGDTDTWTGGDWQRAAILLASAIVSVTGDIEKIPVGDRLADSNWGERP